MRAYSIDLRERVVRASDEAKGTQAEIAKLFGISVSWLKKLRQRRRETGSIAPKPHGGGWTPKFSGAKLERLKALVEQDPDATLAELLERSGVDGSIMAVHRALERLGCRRKKSRSGPPNKIARTCRPNGTPGGRRRPR
jgi:transposase